jgi:hypothetical protein
MPYFYEQGLQETDVGATLSPPFRRWHYPEPMVS